jgi:hypothetical protein
MIPRQREHGSLIFMPSVRCRAENGRQFGLSFRCIKQRLRIKNILGTNQIWFVRTSLIRGMAFERVQDQNVIGRIIPVVQP